MPLDRVDRCIVVDSVALPVARIPWDGAGLGSAAQYCNWPSDLSQPIERILARALWLLCSLHRDAHARRGNEASGN